MTTGLVTTTINIPYALELIARQDETLQIFIAADEKTPPEAETWVYEHCAPKSRVSYLTVEQQKDREYKHSELIGWNTDSRRNIAVLEALRAGCHLIVSWDDDMVVYKNFIEQFEDVFGWPYSGLQLGFESHWFDAGQYTIPIARQRGLPVDVQIVSGVVRHIAKAEIGAAQGVILGVPDTDACTSLVSKPFITGMTSVLSNGFVANSRAHAVFNSQLTMFRAELAPAFAQFYFAQGRNTDIFASMMMRRIMHERNLYTYYGLPAAFHARKPRPLLKDLQAERYGVDNIAAYADYLDRALLRDASVVDQCRILYEGWNGPEKEAALAWCEDVESVL